MSSSHSLHVLPDCCWTHSRTLSHGTPQQRHLVDDGFSFRKTFSLVAHWRERILLSLVCQGNSVTAIQQMQQCFNDIIMTPTEDARSTYECIVASDGPIRTLQILINGIIQQSFGYLPPTLVLALENGQCSPLVSLRSLCLTLVAALTRRTT